MPPVSLMPLTSRSQRLAARLAAVALGLSCAMFSACAIAYTIVAATAHLRGNIGDALFVFPALACYAIGLLFWLGSRSLQRQAQNTR